MNCKQGDLAIVIKSDAKYDDWIIGKVVKVVEHVLHPDGRDAWRMESELRHPFGLVSYPFIIDAVLRPVSGLPMEEDVRDEIKEKA